MDTQHIVRLVTDIDDAALNGMAVGGWWLSMHAHAPWYAMCRRGDTPVMRMARTAGCSGFFLLNRAGVAIERDRGMARELLIKMRSSRLSLPDGQRQRLHTSLPLSVSAPSLVRL